jgi:fermentation-respiration switch protein FrsA (DUF1100 family)
MPITAMHASTASAILSAVQNTLSTKGLSSVTVVGHSLGAALALLDGVFFSLQLPENVTVKVTQLRHAACREPSIRRFRR